jgi:phage-related protein
MPIILPPTFQSAIEPPQAANQIVTFVEIQIARPIEGTPVVPSTIFRISNWHATLTWPTNLSQVWYPFSFEVGPVEQNLEGDLPQLDLAVDNTARTLMRYLHGGDGLEGNYCTIYLVPANALNLAHPNEEYTRLDLQIAGCSANDEVVQFRLERANFFTRNSPQDRFTAARCRWEFGSKECGYVINAVAAFTTCPKLIAACQARGADHRSRGLPVLHPMRFGGFPGIPQQR